MISLASASHQVSQSLKRRQDDDVSSTSSWLSLASSGSEATAELRREFEELTPLREERTVEFMKSLLFFLLPFSLSRNV